MQDALAVAISGDEIWVAQGIYKPDQGSEQTPGDRYATFQLISGVAIYGGFPSGGCALEDRDPTAHETILSGDLLGDDGPDFANNSENSYHVVTGSGTDETAIFDGFTIIGGNGSGSYVAGGGMYNYSGSPTVSNCTFSANSASSQNGNGGGMYNEQSSPILTACIFSGNSARLGGGMQNRVGSSPTLTDCTFNENRASGYWGAGGGMLNLSGSSPILNNCAFNDNWAEHNGGAMSTQVSSCTVTNCSFTGNSAVSWGGGMRNYKSTLILTNCTFSGNYAGHTGGGINNDHENTLTLANCTFSGNSSYTTGGGINNDYENTLTLTNCTFSGNMAMAGGLSLNCTLDAPSNLTIVNCIFWDGANAIRNNNNSIITIDYSDVEGGWIGLGGNNIDADPLFVDPLNDDFHLQSNSPCIDAGDNAAVTLDTDLDGNQRISNGIVDMGVYEFVQLINALVDINPDTLNMKSRGQYVTVYITLPDGYNVADIDTASIQIADISGDPITGFSIDESFTPVIGDRDEDEIPDLSVKFDRQALIALPLIPGDRSITIEGDLTTSEHFSGSDTIRVIDRGK